MKSKEGGIRRRAPKTSLPVKEGEARKILERLVENDPQLLSKARRVRSEVAKAEREGMKGVGTDEVAREVYDWLELIDVETLWDRSGPTRDGGYYDPVDASWDMFEEEMSRFKEALRDYWKERLREDGARYCLGILKGLALFKTKGTTQYREWCGDDPYIYARDILEEWKRLTRGGPWFRNVIEALATTLPPEFLDYVRPERVA